MITCNMYNAIKLYYVFGNVKKTKQLVCGGATIAIYSVCVTCLL